MKNWRVKLTFNASVCFWLTFASLLNAQTPSASPSEPGTRVTAHANGPFAKGSGAYVAIERVSGTLKGRAGSFTWQHSGTMNKGATQLVITIVPDSATGQLVGIAGEMTLYIAAGGKRSYDLKDTLPKTD